MENKETTTQYPIKFSFRKINTEQFAIIEDAYNEKGEVTLAINTKFSINPELREAASHVTINFNCNKSSFLIIQVVCFLRIEEKAWTSWASDAKITIPASFATHMIVLTVGTLRGILHSKTEGTIFNRYIVPPVKVTDLVKENIEFIVDIKKA